MSGHRRYSRCVLGLGLDVACSRVQCQRCVWTDSLWVTVLVCAAALRTADCSRTTSKLTTTLACLVRHNGRDYFPTPFRRLLRTFFAYLLTYIFTYTHKNLTTVFSQNCDTNLNIIKSRFSARLTALHRAIAIGRLSVWLSVRLSHSWAMPKRFKISKYISCRMIERLSKYISCRMIERYVYFLEAKFLNCEFRGSLQTSALKRGTPVDNENLTSNPQ